MILVVMGVSGCGKTVVGQALAKALGWPFLDGDDFHPPGNVEKMRSGTPLTDDDRWPWLDRIAAEMRAVHASGGQAVLACSALKQSYRDRLAAWTISPQELRFVHLVGDYDTLASRLASRQHRYMPPTLLASQFATLEPPADAIDIDVRMPVAEQVAAIRAALKTAPVAS